MTAPVFATPLYPVFHGLDGLPLDGGSIYIGRSGQSAEAAPLQVYWDEARTQPIAQPVRTINGYPARNGSPASIYVESSATVRDYSITVRDAEGRIVYTALRGLDLAQAAVDSAWQAAGAAAAFDGNGLWVDSAPALQADTAFTYAAGEPGTVVAGQWIRSRKEGFIYRVASSGASDNHVVTAGGVKLYVEPQDGFVSVDAFFAVGNGSTDDTTAIRAALTSKYNVVFPKDQYRVTGSLTVYDQKVHGRGKHLARAETRIFADGNFACFINPTDFWNQCEIDGFFIDYGGTAPATSTGNSNKIGVKFVNAPVPPSSTGWPEQIRITNVTVNCAWYGFYDDTGAYMSVLERVEARDCKHGFYKQNGTTITFINCFARGDAWKGVTANSETGFTIREVLAPSFIACAADGLTPAANSADGAANFFEGCRAITINGWDAESNNIATTGAAQRCYMRFVDGAASISGFIGYQNKLTFNSGEAYLILNDGCNLHFSGQTGVNTADLLYVGTGGIPITIKTTNGGKTLITGSQVDNATGGAPLSSFALVGDAGTQVDYSGSTITGLITGASELLSLNRWVALPYTDMGAIGMFLNATNALIVEGQVVPGSSLIWAAASGTISGVDSPSGSWVCLGTAAANTVPAVPNPNCVSIFKRVL